MRTLHLARLLLAALCAASCVVSGEATIERTGAAPAAPAPPAAAVPEPAPPAAAAAPQAPTPAAEARVLPFDPSPEDRPHLGCAGFAGTRRIRLADGTDVVGPVVHGVIAGTGLAAAGVAQGEVIVGVAGQRIATDAPDPIGRFRELLDANAPDSETVLDVVDAGGALRAVRVRLGRRPPPFARRDTPAAWMPSDATDPELAALVAAALALDGGAARFEDTLARNRRAYARHDPFRLRPVTEAHMNPAAQERLARSLVASIADEPRTALEVAGRRGERIARAGTAVGAVPGLGIPEGGSVDAIADAVAAAVVRIHDTAERAFAAWTDAERAAFVADFPRLTERVNQGELLGDDTDPLRERANRRTVALLARADLGAIAEAALLADALVLAVTEPLHDAVRADGRDGLLASRDTPAGRVEIWGGGSQRHTRRCAFLFDFAGDDAYHDVAGRADPSQRVSIYVDASGDDLWAATSDFGLCGALGGVARVEDWSGDDQYLSRGWSQAAAVAGFALLEDGGGRDVYHAQDIGQGAALAGGAVLSDAAGDDLYTGVRFCQGVGFAGGAGALLDGGGDDRYVCTGRYDSEYGEPGLFSGWGQGCGFGFRHVASGGIGLLADSAGDDVYEAGNFSQGGGYFYAWGVLRDGAGNDRYVGSRYAQGFAAHQAVGTFLEDAGDDLYQSHAGVAQGLSWDETSVVFRDRAGNDRYRTAGFSLAAAAHNGMVIFLDDAGDDRYAALPARAGSNEYHGGRSFALFADRGGSDTYDGADAREWNLRAAVRDDGAYHLDLAADGGDPAGLLR